MRKHPVLLGMMVFTVLFSLFVISIWALSYIASREESWWGDEKIAIVDIKGVIIDLPTCDRKIDQVPEE